MGTYVIVLESWTLRLPVWTTKRELPAIFLYLYLVLSGTHNCNWPNQFVNKCWLHLYGYNHPSRPSVMGLKAGIRWQIWPAAGKKAKWRFKRSKLWSAAENNLELEVQGFCCFLKSHTEWPCISGVFLNQYYCCVYRKPSWHCLGKRIFIKKILSF